MATLRDYQNRIWTASQRTPGCEYGSVWRWYNVRAGTPKPGRKSIRGNRSKLYLNPSAFALPAAGTFGDLQSYGIKGPHYDNWDISVQKNFQIHGPVALDFRAEMFNFPNHLSAFTVDTTTTDSSFGDVTGTTDPRTVEFALKAHF